MKQTSQMENTKEINCPNCQQKVAIPDGSNTTQKCPNCNQEFEVDSTITIKPKKTKYRWILNGLLLGLSIIGYSYYQDWNKNRNPDLDTIVEDIKSNSNSDGGNTEKPNYDKELNALVQAIDISNETTNDYAVRLAQTFPGEYNIGQVCKIYDYVVRNWKYVNDANKRENYRSASRTIKNNLAGDCDDFAILIAALIESIGGHTRISFAYNDESGHAFTEVFVAESKEEAQIITDRINEVYQTNQFDIHFFEDENGRCWLNLDWFGQPQHPGGKYFDFTKRIIFYPTQAVPSYEVVGQ